MNLKKIIILAASGLLSFAGAFIFTRLTQEAPPTQSPEQTESALAGEVKAEPPQLQAGMSGFGITGSGVTKSMTEKQLEKLVYDVREKIREYKDKLIELQMQEQRLQVTRQTLKTDIEKLDNLRTELTSIVVNLKNMQDKLQKSRVEIAATETSNLRSIASTYNRMDPASASTILINMSQMKTADGKNALDDVVKILHYMEDRTKANLLAQLSTSEPKLAALLCQKLKKIVENN